MSKLDYKFTLTVPFLNASQSKIAAQTLSPDPILKGNEITVDYRHEEANLVVCFAGVSDRVIRVAISNVIENIKTIIECIDEFDGEKDTIFE